MAVAERMMDDGRELEAERHTKRPHTTGVLELLMGTSNGHVKDKQQRISPARPGGIMDSIRGFYIYGVPSCCVSTQHSHTSQQQQLAAI